MRNRFVTAALVALAVVYLGPAPVLAEGAVTYTASRGDGCGPPTQDGFAWATFVVLDDRICGSYPWDAQEMVAGGSVAFYNRGAASQHLTSWQSRNSRDWSLDEWLGAGDISERRIYRPGKYLFRDPAHSRLVRVTRADGTVDTKCLGACGYLRVVY